MFNKIQEITKATTHAGQVITTIGNFEQMYEANFCKDGVSKDDFLDTICSVIQSLKSVPAVS
jgi:hypothetical protein